MRTRERMLTKHHILLFLPLTFRKKRLGATIPRKRNSARSNSVPPSRQAASVTDVGHLTGLDHDLAAVLPLDDTDEADNQLSLSALKRKNKKRRQKQVRKLQKLTFQRQKERRDFQ